MQQMSADHHRGQDPTGRMSGNHSSSGLSEGRRSSSFPGFALPGGASAATSHTPHAAAASYADDSSSKARPSTPFPAADAALRSPLHTSQQAQQQDQQQGPPQQQEVDRLLAGLTPANAAALVAAAASAMSNGSQLDWLLPVLAAVQQHTQPEAKTQGQPDQQVHQQQQQQQHPAPQQGNEATEALLGLLSSASQSEVVLPRPLMAPSLAAPPSLSSLLPASTASVAASESTWQVRDPMSMQSSGLQHIVRQMEQQQQQHAQQRVQQHGQPMLPRSSSSNSSQRKRRAQAEAGPSVGAPRLPPGSGIAAASGSAAALPALPGVPVALPAVSQGLLLPGTSSLPNSITHLDAAAAAAQPSQQLKPAAASDSGMRPAAASAAGAPSAAAAAAAAVAAAVSGRPHSAPAAAAAAAAVAPKPSPAASRGGSVASQGPLVPSGASGGSGAALGLKKSGASRGAAAQSASAARFMWTPELHQLFLTAVEELGGEEAATPAEILTRMAVEGLSRDNVKSHLQRHRQNMREQRLLQQLQQHHDLPPASNSAPAGLAAAAAAGELLVSGGLAPVSASAPAAAHNTLQPASQSAAPAAAAAAPAAGTPGGSPTSSAAAAAAGGAPSSPGQAQQQQQQAPAQVVRPAGGNSVQWGRRRVLDSEVVGEAAAARARDHPAAAAAGPVSPARAEGQPARQGLGITIQTSPQSKRAPKRSLTADVLMAAPAAAQQQQQQVGLKPVGPDVVAEAAEAAAAEATAAANAAAAAAAAASASAASVPGISGALSGFWRQQQQQGLYGSCPDLGLLASAAASGGELPGSTSDLQGQVVGPQDPAAAAAAGPDVSLVFDQGLAHRAKRRGGLVTAWDDGLHHPAAAAAAGASPASPKGWWGSSSSGRGADTLLPASPFETVTQQQGLAASRRLQQGDSTALHMEPSLAYQLQQQQAALASGRWPRGGQQHLEPPEQHQQHQQHQQPAAAAAAGGLKRAPRSVASKSSRGRGQTPQAAVADDGGGLFGLELLSEVAVEWAEAGDPLEHQQQQQQQEAYHHQQQQQPAVQAQPAAGKGGRRGRPVKRRSDPGVSASKDPDWMPPAASVPHTSAGQQVSSQQDPGVDALHAAAQIFGLAGNLQHMAAGQEPVIGIPLLPPGLNGTAAAAAQHGGAAGTSSNVDGAKAAAEEALRAGPPPARGLPVSFQVVPALPVPAGAAAAGLPQLPQVPTVLAAAVAAAAAAAAPGSREREASGSGSGAAAPVPAIHPPGSPASPGGGGGGVGVGGLELPSTIISPASRAHQAEAAAAAATVAAAVTAGPVDLVLCNSTTALLSAVLAPLDPINRACLAAVLQLLTLQGVISWHDPPLQGPQGPPPELTALLQAFMAQAAAQHGMTVPAQQQQEHQTQAKDHFHQQQQQQR